MFASRIWSAILKPSQTSGTATSTIQTKVSAVAASVALPFNQRVSRRISGQLANASTAAQNSAEANGASTHRQAPSNSRSRICTSRRSLLSMHAS